MEAIVTETGAITIPEELRRKLGIAPNTVMDFQEENGKLLLVKSIADDPVSRVMGCLKSDLSTDEIMTHIRGTK